ncbi:reverse transcriptase [Senna tora]|uniref:Reverse transcriptase n=1 Tax=Senna tora TaxID=362788 RepID=A0A834X055_9FABA|nr:reverse transcriptase [Senna tora]
MDMQVDEVELLWDEDVDRCAANYTLIGKVLAEKVLNRNAVVSMIRKGWNVKDGVNIGEVGNNSFIFTFENKEVYNKVMRNRPWAILGYMLVIQKWRVDMAFHEVDLGVSPIWIQIHGLPLEGFNKKNAENLGRRVGDVFAVEDPLAGKKVCGCFLRVGFKMDTRKPLVTGMWITAFGKVGEKEGNVGEEFKYGPGLGVPPAKELKGSVIVVKAKYEEWYGEKVEGGRYKGEACREKEELKGKNVNETGTGGKGDVSGSNMMKEKDNVRIMENGKDRCGGSGEVKISRVMHNIREAVCFDNIRDPGYFVEMPQDEDGVKDLMVTKSREEEELTENLKKVVIKRKEDEMVCSAEIKRVKREIYVIEKEDFDKGKEDLMINDKRRRKKKMSKVVMESLQLVEIPIVEGRWDGKELKRLCRVYKPSIVFLMEIRMKEKKMDRMRKKCCGLENGFYVDAMGKSGGMALWWSNEVDIMHIRGSKNIIHGLVCSKMLEGASYFTFVYGAQTKQEKMGVWSELRRLKPGDDVAWFCLGNFNDILSNSEKEGGLIREQYQNAQVLHLEAVGSDHCPIVVNLKYKLERIKRSFKFEAMWVDHDEFLDIVDEGWKWEKVVFEQEAKILSRRLEQCGRVLSGWSKRAFPNNLKEIDKLTSRLSICRSGPFTLEVRKEISCILKDIEMLWDREEKFWQQSDGNWVEDEEFVGVCFKNYFDGLFKSKGSRDMSYVLSFVSRKVFTEDNVRLMEMVSVDEIKKAAFDLDVLSAMLNQATREGLICGIKLARACPSLTHCFFADDSLLFLNASKGDCEVVAGILKAYCEASGQDMNLDKSSLFYSRNTPDCVKGDICNTLGIVESSNPGRYLGLPTLWERSKVVALAFVKDRMMRKIQSWKQKTLTQVGREVLIKAVVSSIPGFLMGVFKFPRVFCKELDAAVARFWWSGKEEGGKIHWQAWLKKGFRASWGWSSLLVGRDTLKLGIGWKLASPAPNANWEGRKVSSIISGNSWKLGELHNCLSSAEVKAIMGLHISSIVFEDERVWFLDRRGEYKVKSGYQIAKKAFECVEVARPSSFVIPKGLWGAIWKLKVVEKVKHFIWRICSNSLPSMVNLSKKRCLENASCLIYNMEEESSEHLFLFCKWTELVWFRSLFCARWNRFEVKRMEEWWSDLLVGDARVDDWVASLFAYTCWHIWKERFKAIFDHGKVDASFVIQRSFSATAEFWSVNRLDNCVGGNNDCSFDGWLPPSSGVLKVNCDAAFDESSGVAGIGELIRDDKGRLVDGKCLRVKACSVNMAESLALKEALGFCLELHIDTCLFESDCLNLVTTVNQMDVNWDWLCFGI